MIKKFIKAITGKRDIVKSDEENRELCQMALFGFKLLSSWTSKVTELVGLVNVNYFNNELTNI